MTQTMISSKVFTWNISLPCNVKWMVWAIFQFINFVAVFRNTFWLLKGLYHQCLFWFSLGSCFHQFASDFCEEVEWDGCTYLLRIIFIIISIFIVTVRVIVVLTIIWMVAIILASISGKSLSSRQHEIISCETNQRFWWHCTSNNLSSHNQGTERHI